MVSSGYEKSCAVSAAEQNKDVLRHEAHAVLKNNLVVVEYSCGTGCARSLEQFYITLKRIHGISLGAQRLALPAGGRDETTPF